MNFINIPIVTKYLLIINLIFLAFTSTIAPQLESLFAIRYFGSPEFGPWQIVTSIFTHSGFSHLFFNMFSLFVFGSALERTLGSKQFLQLFFLSAMGGVFLRQVVYFIEVQNALSQLPADAISKIINYRDYIEYPNDGNSSAWRSLGKALYTTARGASGATYGLLVAFGTLFPNAKMMPMFIPVEIKAKHLVIILITLAIFLELGSFSGDNIGHLAHLGGALFGYIFIRTWKKNKTIF